MAEGKRLRKEGERLLEAGRLKYITAAKAMLAAQAAAEAAGEKLSQREMDRELGLSSGHCGRVIRWHQSGGLTPHPWWRGPSPRTKGGNNEWYTRPKYIEAA